MIKLLEVIYLSGHQLELSFSNGDSGIFDGSTYLEERKQYENSLLTPLKNEAYFAKCFIEAGALCWPNGLALSAARLHELALTATANPYS